MEKYGASLMKIGWHAKIWSDEHFRVLDVARRVGSGVGSFGVGRYYVLLAGNDPDNEDAVRAAGWHGGAGGRAGMAPSPGAWRDANHRPTYTWRGAIHRFAWMLESRRRQADGHGIILDVKYEPEPAVLAVLDGADAAWYHNQFSHEAQRAVLAQRALTSYTDPYAGWVFLGGKAHVVRERSPYKDSFPLESLQTFSEFTEYSETARGHLQTRACLGTAGGCTHRAVRSDFI